MFALSSLPWAWTPYLLLLTGVACALTEALSREFGTLVQLAFTSSGGSRCTPGHVCRLPALSLLLIFTCCLSCPPAMLPLSRYPPPLPPQGYAWEITTKEGGWGLDGLLRGRSFVLNGEGRMTRTGVLACMVSRATLRNVSQAAVRA